MATNLDAPLRAGILGYGFAGRGFHAYLLAHEPRIRLAAVASRDPERRERAASEYGVRTYETLEQLLDSGAVDLVIVATPHNVHASQVLAALRAGKHCVVDKVMCLTSAEADEMLAAGEAAGRMLSVFHNRRWDGDYMTIRRAVAAGLLGTLRLLEIGIWRYGAPRGWRSIPEQVGTVMHDWGAHFVDQLLQLVPAPVREVRARARHDWPGVAIESYIAAEIEFENGVLARLELCNRAHLGKPHWFLVGDSGSLVKDGVDPQEAAMLRGDLDAAREDPGLAARVRSNIDGLATEMRLETLRGDWKAYYRNIADHLLEGAELAVRPEEARRGVALLEAVAHASRSGAPVRVASGI
jgi:scyllo-inositol 2-dehydrogenase (NADP+)